MAEMRAFAIARHAYASEIETAKRQVDREIARPLDTPAARRGGWKHRERSRNSYGWKPRSRLIIKHTAAFSIAIMSAPGPCYDQLAFSGGGGGDVGVDLLTAKVRRPFRPSTSSSNSNCLLNVEIFGSPEGVDDSSWPSLLFVHGVCESAETWTVQNLARAAQENKWRMAVLEIEGHGLSTGQRSVRGSFSRLIEHAEYFVHHVLSSDVGSVPFAICGASLGGVLAAYVADRIASNPRYKGNFIGAIPIVPAVGVAPEAVPPAPIVGALRILAAIAPGSGFLTPVEDPSHYACPPNTKRNFQGQWPLSTSKMLLDVTSGGVEKDQNSGKLNMDIPSLLVIAGERDEIIPVESITSFYEKAKSQDKQLVKVPRVDHSLMVGQKTAKFATQIIFKWLNERRDKL